MWRLWVESLRLNETTLQSGSAKKGTRLLGAPYAHHTPYVLDDAQCRKARAGTCAEKAHTPGVVVSVVYVRENYTRQRLVDSPRSISPSERPFFPFSGFCFHTVFTFQFNISHMSRPCHLSPVPVRRVLCNDLAPGLTSVACTVLRAQN